MKHEPVTPKIGCDSFVVNDRNEVCLIRRTDNGLWAMPGGYQDLGETPAECASREFHEETGLHIRIVGLLGVFSSLRYPAITNVNRSREVTHVLFRGECIEGHKNHDATPHQVEEVAEVAWFGKDHLPDLSDGHLSRLNFAFQSIHLRQSTEGNHPQIHFE